MLGRCRSWGSNVHHHACALSCGECILQIDFVYSIFCCCSPSATVVLLGYCWKFLSWQGWLDRVEFLRRSVLLNIEAEKQSFRVITGRLMCCLHGTDVRVVAFEGTFVKIEVRISETPRDRQRTWGLVWFLELQDAHSYCACCIADLFWIF